MQIIPFPATTTVCEVQWQQKLQKKICNKGFSTLVLLKVILIARLILTYTQYFAEQLQRRIWIILTNHSAIDRKKSHFGFNLHKICINGRRCCNASYCISVVHKLHLVQSTLLKANTFIKKILDMRLKCCLSSFLSNHFNRLGWVIIITRHSSEGGPKRNARLQPMRKKYSIWFACEKASI